MKKSLAKKIVILVETNTGDVHQVILQNSEENMVVDLLSQLHGGKIKCFETKFPEITIGPQKS